MMKKLYFLFMLLVGLNSVYSQAAFNSPTTPILTIGTITDAVPGAIVVPVHAANIVNLGAFQFAIEYDPAIMTYTGTSNWYTGIEAVTIGNPLSGHLTFVWASDAQEINIPDNIFFNLNFTYISGTSAVNWSDNPTPRKFADYDGNIFVPTYVNGNISGNTTPQPILSVTPANQNVTSPAGTTSFAVTNTGTGSMSYSAAVTTGSDWLSISNGSTGGNNGIIATAYSQNNSSTFRVGTITITASGAIGSPKQVTVTQAAFNAQAFTFTQENLTYNENFDAMGYTGTTYLPGWVGARFLGTGAIGATLVMAVSDGTLNLGNVYNVGTTDATDRAMGTLGSSVTIPRFGASFLNNTGTTITQVDFTGVMEQWRTGSNAVVEDVVFNYSIDATDLMTGTWQPLTSMDLVEKQTGSTVAAALNGNLRENQTVISGTITGLTWFPNTTLWISWTDNNDMGSDGMYAIDDFHMTVTTGGLTPDPEPTNYSTDFTTISSGFSVKLNWTDAIGAQLPAGYLIKASTINNITIPVDGTPVTDDIDLSDGTGAKNISQGVETYTFNNLPENSTIYFKIYPYTNAGAYINYKTDGTVPAANASTPSVIHTQNFDSGLAPWTTYSIIGDQVWTLDTLHGVGGSKCMKMTGYLGGASFDNEDWLISSPINLSGFINTSLNFQTAMNYGADTTTWFSALVSTNYTGSGDPNNATWIPLAATLSPGNWAWTSSGIIDISALSGKTFYLAFKYTCNATNARTWEMDNVMIMGVPDNSPTLSIATLDIVEPGTIIVPVNASNITNMGSFQFTINYDPSKLTFNGISNWYSGINAVTVGNPSPGKITCVWAAEDYGIFITNNTFFEMNFTASGSSALNWNDNPTPREFGDFNGNIFVPVYNNGGVNLILPPQPILSVTPANQNVTSPAGTTSFAVTNTGTGSMSYSAAVTTGSDWLSISNGSTGGNNGIIVTAYSQNNSSTSRVGTITITAPGAIGSPQQVTVTQAAAPPPSPELTIGTVNTNSGTVIVPVTVQNLINLGSFQFSISYDVSKLTYIKDTNWYAGITDVTINSSIPGKVSFVWAANTPVTILDNTFFELKFATNAAGTSIIAWTDNPTPREFADWDGNNFEPVYENGSVNCAIAPQHFVFEGGNPADPVWTIYLSDAILNGIDLQPMDEIAIFDGETMVGSLRLTEVLTPATWSSHYITAFQTLTNGAGYVPGHPFTFKCWDVSTQEEISYVNTNLTDPYGDAYTGNVFPSEDGQYSIAYLSFLSIVTQWYSLNTGYQFISSHVVPTNPDMMVILDDLLDNSLGFVRNSGGNMFRKIGPNWLNNIGNWVTVEGYLFKMNASEDFLIQGTPINAQTPIALSTGYQFISYLPKNPMSATTAYAGIMNDNLSFIRNSGGNMLRKLGPNWVNNIGNVIPGEGYLVKMNAPATLIYPAGTKSESTKNKVAIQHFNFEGGNAADPVYTIYISDATINGYSLQSGDEIGVFDGQTLVGSLALTQTPTPDNQTENAIPVFATLNSGEGFTANHPVTYKVWSALQAMEYEGVNVTLSNPYGDSYTDNVFPNSDGIYSIASLTATLTGINSLDRTEVAVYPNPSNGTFTLELNSVHLQAFDVMVYNSLGVAVYQQLNVAANGKYSTEIGLGDLPEGIYTLTVTGKDANYIKKIIIRK